MVDEPAEQPKYEHKPRPFARTLLARIFRPSRFNYSVLLLSMYPLTHLEHVGLTNVLKMEEAHHNNLAGDTKDLPWPLGHLINVTNEHLLFKRKDKRAKMQNKYELYDDKEEAHEQLHEIFKPLQDVYAQINHMHTIF